MILQGHRVEMEQYRTELLPQPFSYLSATQIIIRTVPFIIMFFFSKYNLIVI